MRTTRRALLASAALAPLAALAQPALAQPALVRPAQAQRTQVQRAQVQGTQGPGTNVADVTQAVALDDRVAGGYRRSVLIRWGDRVTYDAPPWNPNAPDERAAHGQFAWDAVVAGFVEPPPAADGVRRLVLTVAHPRADPRMIFPSLRSMPGVEAAMVGASVLNLVWRDGRWVIADGGFQTRRLTGTTLCRVGGPLAGDVRQRTPEDPVGAAVRGIIAPECGAPTPWGSMLLGEGDASAEISAWRSLGPRFTEPNEPLRFGWAVEFDPLDPTSIPVKRTALGRFPRGGLAPAIAADGRLVLYMSERRAGGHLYRFVSARPIDATDRGANADLLDEGTLSVAVVGTSKLDWAGLGQSPDTLLDLRSAAARLGATRFDNPAGIAVHPDGRVFLACRGASPPGSVTRSFLTPSGPNTWGHVVEIIPPNRDHAAADADGAVLIVGGDPSQPGSGARYGQGTRVWLAAPEALAVDVRGRLWIGTAQGNAAPGMQARTGIADGVFVCGTAAGASRGVLRQAYAAPRAARIGGLAFSPEATTLVTAVRTPGYEQGADFTRPATRWPDFQPGVPPRSTVIALAREDGGQFGG